MAVAFDAASQSHTTPNVSASEASFSWTHTPVGTPRGVVVFTVNLDSTSAIVSGVTYGGVPLTQSGLVAADTATELGRCTAWILGSGVPTGAQTIQVNRTNNANSMVAFAATVTAGGDTELYEPGAVLDEENGTLAARSVSDGSPATGNSVRFGAGMSGLGAAPALATGSTGLLSIDPGAQIAIFCRETTAGNGARNVGFSSGTSDDRALIYVAVRQAAIVTANLSGTAAGTGGAAGTLATPGATQWSLTATKATPAAQTGPSWAITADLGANVSVLWAGAIKPDGAATVAALSGTAAGVGAATGALTATKPISGTAAGVSSATGALTAPPQLSGAAAGVGTATGALAAVKPLGGTSAGAGSATGVLTAPPQLSGTAAGVGSATGSLTVPGVAALSGTAAGSGGATGALTAPPLISGTAAGAGSSTGALTAPPKLSGSASGAGSASGSLTASPRLSGTAAGIGGATGSLTTPIATGITQWSLTAPKASPAAQTGPSWSFDPDSATAQVSITWAGAIVPHTAAASLSGVAAGTGGATGVLTVPSPAMLGTFQRFAPGLLGISMRWNVVAAGTGGASGTLSTGGASISGTAAGVGGATGALSATQQMSGTAAGVGGATGALTVTRLLSGTAAGTSSATGALRATRQLGGTAAGAGSASGTLTTITVPQLSGNAAGVGGAAGTIRVALLISGIADGFGGAIGLLHAGAGGNLPRIGLPTVVTLDPQLTSVTLRPSPQTTVTVRKTETGLALEAYDSSTTLDSSSETTVHLRAPTSTISVRRTETTMAIENYDSDVVVDAQEAAIALDA